MRALLFCQHPYAIGILKPLCNILKTEGHTVMWYLPVHLAEGFPFKDDRYSSDMAAVADYNPEAIFVPGNEVPHYLPGAKVQIFHGFAGEKKGHFRIRHYFDLYLTQGPYFTTQFRQLAKKHGNFSVAETGWCKLDPLFQASSGFNGSRKSSGKGNVILYAPTFSPSLTSARIAFKDIVDIAEGGEYKVVVKFHDLTDPGIIEQYTRASVSVDNLIISTETNILPVMAGADILISDTSSAVYEFLLLNKPVVTIRSSSPHPNWADITDPAMIHQTVETQLSSDPYSKERKWFYDNYHPYSDGNSSSRMIAATEAWIKENGVPRSRQLSPARRWKINSIFGKNPGLKNN
ncbi:MAG: CDP-glycerol glycerophosphotransferase family protein [Bacteroidales bacterium]|nr:CDP-glycerol glycerophosphotransferase family protein [Bacteroidales bacterium]